MGEPARPVPPASPGALSPVARRILERSGLGGAPAPAPPCASRAFVRAESEDDDGYDPYSDRPAAPEQQWQADPWS